MAEGVSIRRVDKVAASRDKAVENLLRFVDETDRLYRNFRDAVTLEDLDIETHLVKENQVISKDAKSQSRFIHGINLVVARNYTASTRLIISPEKLAYIYQKLGREWSVVDFRPRHAPIPSSAIISMAARSMATRLSPVFGRGIII